MSYVAQHERIEHAFRTNRVEDGTLGDVCNPNYDAAKLRKVVGSRIGRSEKFLLPVGEDRATINILGGICRITNDQYDLVCGARGINKPQIDLFVAQTVLYWHMKSEERSKKTIAVVSSAYTYAELMWADKSTDQHSELKMHNFSKGTLEPAPGISYKVFTTDHDVHTKFDNQGADQSEMLRLVGNIFPPLGHLANYNSGVCLQTPENFESHTNWLLAAK